MDGSINQSICRQYLWVRLKHMLSVILHILSHAPLFFTLINTPAFILGAFAKLRKATSSFVVSVRLSVGMEKLGSHWTDFHEIWYLRFFRKSVKKIQVSSKPDKNNGYFIWRPMYIFIISHSFLLSMRNVSDRPCRGNQNTYFVFSDLFSFLKIIPFMSYCHGKSRI